MIATWMLLALGQAHAADAALRPLGKWTAEYGVARCLIARRFGEAAAPVDLGFEVSPKGWVGEIMMIVPGASAPDGERGVGRLTLLPGSAPVGVRWVRLGEAKGRVTLGIVPDVPVSDGIATMDGLTLELGATRTSLAIPAVAGAMRAMKRCNDDLLRSWGADPAAMVEPDPQEAPRWLRPDDYPILAVRAGQQGRSVAIVTFDTAGKPSDCRIVQSSTVQVLDQATCAVARKRAHVPPAPAVQKRYMHWAVRWILP